MNGQESATLVGTTRTALTLGAASGFGRVVKCVHNSVARHDPDLSPQIKERPISFRRGPVVVEATAAARRSEVALVMMR